MAESLKRKTVTGLAWNTVNTISNRIVTFTIGVVLARILCPADYGLTAMIGVFTSILCIFTDGGLSSALIRKENRTEADLSTVFFYNLVTCWLIYAIIFFAAPYIADFYGMPILTKIARINSLGLLISPFGNIQGTLMVTRLDFKLPAIISLTTNITSGVLAIFLAYNGCGVWSLVVQGLLASVINIISKICIVRWYPKTGFSKASFMELFGFSSKMLASQIIGKVYENIAPLVIGKYYSAAQLGAYNRAYGWAYLPSGTFIITLNSVAFPAMSKIQDDISKLGHNYRKMIRLSAFVSFPMMVGLAAIASPLTLFVLTDKWADSIPLLQAICFIFILLPVNTINEGLLLVLGRSDIYLKFCFFETIFSLVVMVFTLPMGLLVYCYGQIAVTVIRFIAKTLCTKKLINVGFTKQVGDILSIFVNSCIMGILCYIVQFPFECDLYKLLVSIPVGVVYYLVSSYYLNRNDMMEIVEVIKDFRKR